MGSKVFVQSYLIASDKKTAGHDPQAGWDGEEYQEVILGQAQVISEAVVTLSCSHYRHSPHGHEVAVEGVVVALVGGAAGLVAAVLAVLDQEGGALVHQGVHTHLRVNEQLSRKYSRR